MTICCHLTDAIVSHLKCTYDTLPDGFFLIGSITKACELNTLVLVLMQTKHFVYISEAADTTILTLVA